MNVRLWGVTIDFGQRNVTASPRTHTGRTGCSSWVLIQAQRRALAKPLRRQVSHFHAAWFENWKWNAIMSFFVHRQSNRNRLELIEQSHPQGSPAHSR